ncbi:MAG: N-acetylmuramoyl-L-alanine amidase [Defluviitaleaceae bacterium]|nr:N-acetylmuramoyl-L-alanine amidase [Defluviitaleaceae bacterium]
MQKKFRGTRGVRNYIQEARELKKTALILCALCVFVFACAAFLFAISREAVPVFAPTEENERDNILRHAEIITTDKPPLIALNWGAGIFFDTYSGEFIFPQGVDYTVEQDFSRRRFTFSFEGIEFALRNFELEEYDVLPLRIFSHGKNFTVQTRRWAVFENGQILCARARFEKIIVLDAGHGGRDRGAPSVQKNFPHESQINLAIVKKILEIYEREKNFEKILIIPTRTDDYFLTTAQRTRVANLFGDYFISVHCNADRESRHSAGTLTLFGNADGSEQLAEIFQTALVAALESNDRGIHHSPQFHLPRESKIPVIILELLFQTNHAETARLADEETQFLIARTISDEILKLPNP